MESVKKISSISGFLSVRYSTESLFGHPIEYSIATITHYITKKCSTSWLSELNQDVKILQIDKLFVFYKEEKETISRFVDVKVSYYCFCNCFTTCMYCSRGDCSTLKINTLFEECFYPFVGRIICLNQN